MESEEKFRTVAEEEQGGLSAIDNLFRFLLEATDLQKALDRVIETACGIEGFDSGGIYLVNPEDDSLFLCTHRGLTREFVETVSYYPATSPNAKIVRMGEPVYDHHSKPVFQQVSEKVQEHIKGSAIIPILHRGQVLACLNLTSHTTNDFTPASKHKVELIAMGISGAVARIRAEEVIRTNRENFFTLFHTIDDLLFILNDKGTILEVNNAVTRQLNYSAEELNGQSVLMIHPPDRRDEAAQIVQEMILGTLDFCYIPVINKNGELLPVETRVTRGFWNGQPAMYGVSRDVSKQEAAEKKILDQAAKLKELNATKDKFFSIISHDLKSPFNALLGFSKILADPDETLSANEIRTIGSSLYRQLTSLYNLLINLLTWSKLQVKKNTVNPRSINLSDAMKRVIELYSGDIHRKELHLINMVTNEKKLFVDPEMLNSILMNILSNAIKFTPVNGKIGIHAQVTGVMTRITIHDSGVGFHPEILTNVFRIDAYSSTQGTLGERGTGLGLVLCKEMVEQNRGSLNIDSEEGKGTTVTITLPNSPEQLPGKN